jgi:outer membrane receptor for ferrienterochelin and colicins
LLIALTLAPAPGSGAEETDDDQTELNAVVVTATRSPTLIRDEPLRVEAVPAEEIEENLTVQPGNLSSVLHELPSVRVQSVAPGLGGAGLQLRGMPARDTLVLSDGLPLLGTETEGFGILQTPPLDLERVEVIKGAASALYGGSALGGVLNLVSHTADADPAVLANVTSRGGGDLVGFLTHKDASPWSGTLTIGAHDQASQDVNRDGWADLPGYRRSTVRPRIWWDEGKDQSLFLTAGFTDEHRTGGTLSDRSLPDGSSFPEDLHTRRWDVGAVSHLTFEGGYTLMGRFSATDSELDRIFGSQRVGSKQTVLFGEEALNGTIREHQWVLGAAFERDQLAVAAVPGISYTYLTPAVFAQDTYTVAPWLVTGASARVDSNNDYGTFVSPRVSALIRKPGSAWSLRTSVAGGYSAPTPFLDEIEATGLGSLLPLHGLHAERAVTRSVDAKWADEGWDVNLSVFDSEIRDPLQAIPSANKWKLQNAPGAQRVPGAEALIGFGRGPMQALASWSYLNATQPDANGTRGGVPLVPRQAGSIDVIFASARRGRIGLELDYTGTQALEYDPYRSSTPAYFSLNALAELRFKGIGFFINAVNLTNVRQTHWDPLIRPSPGTGDNPITEVWAPLDGRTYNIGIHVEL